MGRKKVLNEAVIESQVTVLAVLAPGRPYRILDNLTGWHGHRILDNLKGWQGHRILDNLTGWQGHRIDLSGISFLSFKIFVVDSTDLTSSDTCLAPCRPYIPSLMQHGIEAYIAPASFAMSIATLLHSLQACMQITKLCGGMCT